MAELHERSRIAGIGMTSARTRDRLVQRLREQGIGDPRVLERIRNVPRHMFVDEALASRAYEDTALPIGFGQTISQPYIVARMTEALLEGGAPAQGARGRHGLRLPDRGARAAGRHALQRRAHRRAAGQGAQGAARLQIANVLLRHGDGFEGWPPHAPYDGIIVAAAPLAIPEALLDQLGNGGRLIMPVGPGSRAATDARDAARRFVRARSARSGDVRPAAAGPELSLGLRHGEGLDESGFAAAGGVRGGDRRGATRDLCPTVPARPPRGRTIVVGAGKAAAAMALALDRNWVGDLSGLVVTAQGHGVRCPRIEVIEASHPVPAETAQRAAEQTLRRVRGLGADDLVICLLSGGGSALLPLPAPGLTLDEKQSITRQLLRSGATIGEFNCVRRHLSRIKGGRLAAACHPARVVTLAISDVPGDDPADIASGPTVADPTTCADALAVLDKYRIEASPVVRSALQSR